jgi:hypothetical protein
MASQATTRQQARRAALDVQSRMRQQRAEQERRRGGLAVTVVTALAERDALVLVCEARAATALRSLTENEGLSLREAVQWCGGVEQLTVREAARLRKVEATDATPGVDAQQAPAGAPNEPAQQGASEPATSGPQVVGTG